MTLMQRLNDWLSMSPPSSPLPPSINIDPPLLASLLSVTRLVEAPDPCFQYCSLLAQEAGLTHAEVQLIALGGSVHDLGKMMKCLAMPGVVYNFHPLGAWQPVQYL